MNTIINPALAFSDTEELVVLSREHTANALDFSKLVDAIATAALEYAAGRIQNPERMVVSLGSGGVMLSMPATAHDIGIHKLVNVQPANKARQLPTIHGAVTVCDAETGRLICLLDGPEVTGRRTAAVTLLAIRTLLKETPREILLIGTGVQARYHVQALYALYPQSKIRVRGRSEASSVAFCDRHQLLHDKLAPAAHTISDDVNVVITVTTSTRAVYNEVALCDRLVIGVGAFTPEMAELGKVTLDGSDIFADDPVSARHEAGDLIQAGVDWSCVRSLADGLQGRIDESHPRIFKSIGTGAWDLAAARVALKAIQAEH
ncbi:delta(1)-pyrroline-2-carboxylate reductase family protein [Nitrosomonas sp. HPC101]|uniref:bifunctional Delta(1)-pyrroline-2-carboxylate/Delta(1)-piperideine-2- carboxylate reductase n=1 Tax=Nitrosomonas sp. HPC101 TaxID=1658667 RepID=UPI00136F97F6|nr:bifunctional Delta(1)-pyrroline-2-carboxylate/Delta(1)-piperideine-2-carboxylate reductase [Nitrosomonas sp. HPC101]MXS84353.1 delta(1)-pyrroline-2-carboxylate reductase family protein [Nitrosomonas sp. HPC101]